MSFIRAGKTARNRLALAPMTNCQSHPDGRLSEDEYRWLISRARGGFGIIITAAAHVSEDGQGWPGELGIFSDEHIAGLSRLAKGLRKEKSLSVVQLFHGGMRADERVTGCTPWSASGQIITTRSGTEIRVRGAAEEDILRVKDEFIAAALRAYEAGMDGVELHGAHGYLLSQFMSSYYNRRTDQWGGSGENRCRLLREILQGIRKKIPGGFMVGVRLSPEDHGNAKGLDLDENLQLAGELANDGADYIHVSVWNAFKSPDKYPGDKTIVEYFRQRIPSVPLFIAGSITTRRDLERIFTLGADVAAVGKAAIGNPSWATDIRDPGYIPSFPPYSRTQLKERFLGPAFIEYMSRWPGFVNDSSAQVF